MSIVRIQSVWNAKGNFILILLDNVLLIVILVSLKITEKQSLNVQNVTIHVLNVMVRKAQIARSALMDTTMMIKLPA